MRTTVTLDPDVEQVIRRRMSERGQSFKEALNDVVREGSGMRRSAFTTAVHTMGSRAWCSTGRCGSPVISRTTS